MNKLNELDEVSQRRCRKCDYFNLSIPLDQKQMNCRGYGVAGKGIEECEVYIKTNTLIHRIQYLKGDRSPLFSCGDGELEVDTYEE